MIRCTIIIDSGVPLSIRVTWLTFQILVLAYDTLTHSTRSSVLCFKGTHAVCDKGDISAGVKLNIQKAGSLGKSFPILLRRVAMLVVEPMHLCEW